MMAGQFVGPCRLTARHGLTSSNLISSRRESAANLPPADARASRDSSWQAGDAETDRLSPTERLSVDTGTPHINCSSGERAETDPHEAPQSVRTGRRAQRSSAANPIWQAPRPRVKPSEARSEIQGQPD